MQAFFSCFTCGQKTTTITTPVPISASKVKPLEEPDTNIKLMQQFQDNKSRSATTVTFRTTDTSPSSIQDETTYIQKKIDQMRKKSLPQRKAMQSEFIRQNLSKSAIVYLVEKQWSQKYTSFLKNIDLQNLRSINNNSLLDQNGRLRIDVRERQDYFIINDRVWKFVQMMYGGGPAIVQDLYFPVLQLSNKKHELKMVGITNPLNLCYMISVLQCLFSNQHFAFFFYKRLFDDSKRKMVYHLMLSRIIKQLTETNSDKIDIQQFATAMGSNFDSVQQHDAHQFLLCLTNYLQQQVKPEVAEKPVQSKDAQKAYSTYFRNNKCIIDRLFIGQIQTTVTCTRCDQVSSNFDTFLDVELEIADSLLQNCLKKHFALEKIDDYQCQKCNKRTKASKKYQITKTPNYLILTLKKFGQNGKKMQDRVKYPLQLDIRKICKGHCGDTKYLLQSVLVHKGVRSTKGHYYCYTRRIKKTWHYASDEITKQMEQSDVLGRDAYILFYERAK